MSGEKTAIDLVMAERGNALEEEPEQIDLIEELGLEVSAKVIKLRTAQPAKMGRPPGARNRRTQEMANYLLNRYTSPLEVLAQIAASGTAELAKAIGCTTLEALQERRLAAIALAPYIHQKMPVAVDVTNKREIHLTIVEGLPAIDAPRDDGAGIVDLVAEEITEKGEGE